MRYLLGARVRPKARDNYCGLWSFGYFDGPSYKTRAPLTQSMEPLDIVDRLLPQEVVEAEKSTGRR